MIEAAKHLRAQSVANRSHAENATKEALRHEHRAATLHARSQAYSVEAAAFDAAADLIDPERKGVPEAAAVATAAA